MKSDPRLQVRQKVRDPSQGLKKPVSSVVKYISQREIPLNSCLLVNHTIVQVFYIFFKHASRDTVEVWAKEKALRDHFNEHRKSVRHCVTTSAISSPRIFSGEWLVLNVLAFPIIY